MAGVKIFMTDRVPLKTVVEIKPQSPAIQTEPSKIESRSDGYMEDVDYHRMADFLEISYDDRKDRTMAERLSYLTDWAKELTGSDDRMQIMTAIKDLKSRLGIQIEGKEAIKKLYQWTRLDQNRKRIEKEMELI